MATFFNGIELAEGCISLSPTLHSDDGSCRFFQLPEVKARRAIKGLGGEIACCDDDDVLNEIACSSTHLAYTSDTGSVGVLDIKSGTILPMRTKHSNIAGSVSFIPDRPKELVSGGYDSHLLHFDFTLGTVLSRFDVGSTPIPSSGSPNIALSPPFVISLAMSASGVIAAGTADGQQRKKRRYWEGLKAEKESSIFSIADGPVIGVVFQSSDTIIAASLGGTITKHQITTDEKGARILREVASCGWCYGAGPRTCRSVERYTVVSLLALVLSGQLGKRSKKFIEGRPINERYRLVWANPDIPEETLAINLLLCSNRPTSPVTVTAHYNLALYFLVFILSFGYSDTGLDVVGFLCRPKFCGIQVVLVQTITDVLHHLAIGYSMETIPGLKSSSCRGPSRELGEAFSRGLTRFDSALYLA
ncbi:hypothetical protein BS47DRAFT_1393619 [Hydnum rufescens UP504]|uniref:Uncharacterized protein n=1 Tax=Hydnum rufescens UP504 TaxID=1448309 RepID=A0A9P6AYI9_9AGAM|nr:hypothetical protein BS47DRAFT_1393619 [Hydnum rufescens UP504]